MRISKIVHWHLDLNISAKSWMGVDETLGNSVAQPLIFKMKKEKVPVCVHQVS